MYVMVEKHVKPVYNNTVSFHNSVSQADTRLAQHYSENILISNYFRNVTHSSKWPGSTGQSAGQQWRWSVDHLTRVWLLLYFYTSPHKCWLLFQNWQSWLQEKWVSDLARFCWRNLQTMRQTCSWWTKWGARMFTSFKQVPEIQNFLK